MQTCKHSHAHTRARTHFVRLPEAELQRLLPPITTQEHSRVNTEARTGIQHQLCGIVNLQVYLQLQRGNVVDGMSRKVDTHTLSSTSSTRKRNRPNVSAVASITFQVICCEKTGESLSITREKAPMYHRLL